VRPDLALQSHSPQRFRPPAKSTSPILLGLLCTWFIWLVAPGAQPGTDPGLEHQAYVWQRAWNDPVVQAVGSRAGLFTRWVVLSAEISWKQGKGQLTSVEVDYAAVAQTGRPVGLALRIGPFAGPFQTQGAEFDLLKTTLLEQLRRAKAKSVQPVELQIDFDCAASKLAGYRTWIEGLKREFPSYRLTLTTLPAWLGRPGFADLVKAADGFVLQVHSLNRPSSFDAAFTLCDPSAARRAVQTANQAGVPFRVALPTYGYRCAFDQQNRFLGLSAEGPHPDWPPGTRYKEVRSDPQAMSDLVRLWSTHRPSFLTGILWYRLPVDGDRLNWTWPTLQSVIRGSALQPDLRVETSTEDSLLFEIDLINRGTSDAIRPAQILVRWRGSRLVAADGLAGFTAEDKGPASIQFSSPAESFQQEPFRLEPGRRQRVGWVRFSKPTEVSFEVDSPALPPGTTPIPVR
jgi:hypothetical protein